MLLIDLDAYIEYLDRKKDAYYSCDTYLVEYAMGRKALDVLFNDMRKFAEYNPIDEDE